MLLVHFCSSEAAGTFSNAIINGCLDCAFALSDGVPAYARYLTMTLVSASQSEDHGLRLHPVTVSVDWSMFGSAGCFGPGVDVQPNYLRARAVLRFGLFDYLNVDIFCRIVLSK
jgi:hypothetical protein